MPSPLVRDHVIGVKHVSCRWGHGRHLSGQGNPMHRIVVMASGKIIFHDHPEGIRGMGELAMANGGDYTAPEGASDKQIRAGIMVWGARRLGGCYGIIWAPLNYWPVTIDGSRSMGSKFWERDNKPKFDVTPNGWQVRYESNDDIPGPAGVMSCAGRRGIQHDQFYQLLYSAIKQVPNHPGIALNPARYPGWWLPGRTPLDSGAGFSEHGSSVPAFQWTSYGSVCVVYSAHHQRKLMELGIHGWRIPFAVDRWRGDVTNTRFFPLVIQPGGLDIPGVVMVDGIWLWPGASDKRARVQGRSATIRLPRLGAEGAGKTFVDRA